MSCAVPDSQSSQSMTKTAAQTCSRDDHSTHDRILLWRPAISLTHMLVERKNVVLTALVSKA